MLLPMQPAAQGTCFQLGNLTGLEPSIHKLRTSLSSSHGIMAKRCREHVPVRSDPTRGGASALCLCIMPTHPGACPHSARGRFANRTLQFTVGQPGQCDCDAGSSAAARQQAWLRDVEHRDVPEVAAYFTALYESSTNIDVSAADIAFFWADIPLLGHAFYIWWACVHCNFGTDSIWAPLQDAVLDPCNGYGPPVPFPGFFVQRQATAAIMLTGVPDGVWVEIMRIARIDDKPDGADASTRGQLWMYLAVGSGIWWNTGRSLRQLAADNRYIGAGHASCASARAAGYDSIQLTEFYPSMTLELIDCRGAHLANANETWEQACPPEHMELRAGIPEPRHAPAIESADASSRICHCNPRTSHVDCMPTPPPPPPPPSPPAPLLPTPSPSAPPPKSPFVPPLPAPTGPQPPLSGDLHVVSAVALTAALALLACAAAWLLAKRATPSRPASSPSSRSCSRGPGRQTASSARTAVQKFVRLGDDSIACDGIIADAEVSGILPSPPMPIPRARPDIGLDVDGTSDDDEASGRRKSCPSRSAAARRQYVLELDLD